MGSKIISRLSSLGYEVVAIGRNLNKHALKSVAWHEVVLDNSVNWQDYLDDVSVVYHLAWSSRPSSSNHERVADASINIVGTLRLLDALVGRPNIRFVFPSSGTSVYGAATALSKESDLVQPNCAYGISKLAIEHYLRLYRELFELDSIALRIANLYGPGQIPTPGFGAIATFSLRALQNQKITIFGDGIVIRDYIFIDDVINALITAGETRGGPALLNIGSGIGRSLNEVVEAISFQLKKKIEIEYAPMRRFDATFSILDISLAETTLRWRPKVVFDEGLAATLSYLEEALKMK